MEHIRTMAMEYPTAGTYPLSWTIWGDAVSKRLKMSSTREVRRTVNRISNMLLNGELALKTANAILYGCNVCLGPFVPMSSKKR